MSDYDYLPMGSGPIYTDDGNGSVRVEYPKVSMWVTASALEPMVIRQAGWRDRIEVKWYDARAWIAEKVLRVHVEGDDW